MLVICVVFSTTGSISPPSPLLRAASSMAPTAPIEAASVGVAMPPRIEPSTAKISSTGATSTCVSLRASAKPRGASGSGGIAGAAFGQKIATAIR